ncbi:type II toxin-antitoxin system Phd/YefM family antitoxin [Streptomyces sp. RPA4-5]|uniref:type II toxin-antitoxin system Phd/YefM family antitoxin n=1 Tax=Streptomyces TaxID=1883 RepID=UPI00143ECBF0|nr:MULTISPECIES: type II toxin-antitoxin system Phd/YefM family antitoxin [Streptomyces]MCX4635105.1 type II toxin-antitoxin system Phd/YefM family antitoxin [Streptomyces platensis]QIY58318.1 type II toxin-antitoxin system Phd/YefM family antitoxin [Streptomyces sp. RPA4-5]WJY41527.1 type II toxin-antitoxin system Phd/YefM family antitoxin [Streptomyces sp. P9-2B-2]WSW55391.1 type II toxin-antitoxin system Phd/YefM family antitoxin [Streptomyces platensis]
MAYEIPVTQARAELAELINRVVYGGERVVVTRHGKPLVALVSAAELEQLDSAAQEASERVIGTVSFMSEVPTSSSDQSQFGLIARYDSPYGS